VSSAKRKGVSRKSVLGETGDGYGHKDTAEYDISSGTDRDGPFGTRLTIPAANEKSRSSNASSLRLRRIKETLGTHASTCARHARTIALHACGPIRDAHLIVSLRHEAEWAVYVCCCVENLRSASAVSPINRTVIAKPCPPPKTCHLLHLRLAVNLVLP
jgi:hypothetical protein